MVDLFRRFFGKTNEEMPTEAYEKKTEEKAEGNAEINSSLPPESNVTAELSDWDEIDPKTRPVDTNKNPVVEGVTQPLNPEVLNMNERSRHITFGQATDVGLVRNNNQDAVMSFLFTSASVDDYPDFGLFVVADGMGGHQEGEKAAAISAKTVASHIMKTIYLPLVSGSENDEMPSVSEVLVESVQKSNREVIEQVPDGGTTVTAVAVMGNLAYIAHVGDSRAYLMTSEGIEQLTRDHSLVQRLIELNQLTREDAETHPQKNVLYRALGQNETIEVDTLTRRLPSGSSVVICSDGLWGLIEERELYETTINNPDPQVACDQLIRLAKNNGGNDNVTVIILRVS